MLPSAPLPSGYVPALDGLRGIAVVLVIAFHTMPRTVSGGFLGVDIFFVLSGYLITGLLLAEWREYGRVHLPHFYMRRFLRLTPALSLVVAVYLLAALWFTDSYSDFKPHLQEGAIAWLYVANWARAFDWYPPYFYLSHTWSLAIEEQFYLIWPLVLITLCGRSRHPARALVLATGLTFVAVWTWRAWLLTQEASYMRVYNGLDTRADALMAGALAAAAAPWLQARLGWLNRAWVLGLLLAGLAALVARASWTSNNLYLWQLPLLYAATAGVVVFLAHTPHSLVTCGLGWRPLVFAGRISYGVYLWHVPVFLVLMKGGLRGPALFAVTLIATFALASVSFFVLERPALRLKRRFQPGSGKGSPLPITASKP